MGNRNGHASVKFDNGDTYNGQWKHGKRDGVGQYVYANGDRCVSTSKSVCIDVRRGIDGNDRYEGSYKENKRNGRGVFSYADGSIYTGEYKNDKKHGVGSYTFANGTMYEGSWVDGKKHGSGTHTFPSGARYDGAYKYDHMDGIGTYTYQDGEWYSGSWKDDKMHGMGKLKEGNTISQVKHEYGRLISKEPAHSVQGSAIAHKVLTNGSFNSLSPASEVALQLIEVSVVRARNLTRQDYFGLSDPYAVLQLEEVTDEPPSAKLADWTAGRVVQHKTKTCRNTLDPQWDARFSFVVRTDKKYTLNINVWDWDMAKSDDRLGDLSLTLTPDMLDNAERWYKLKDVPAPSFLLQKAATDISIPNAQPERAMRRSSSSGSVSDNKKKSRNSVTLGSMLSPRSAAKSKGRDTGCLPPQIQLRMRLVPEAHWEVTVLQARNLPKLDVFGKADPYCVLRWGGGDGDESSSRDAQQQQRDSKIHWTGQTDVSRVKTSTKRNTLEPVWNDSFMFPCNKNGKEEVNLSIWDWDLGKFDDFVGNTRIPVEENTRLIARRKPYIGVTAWYKVCENEGGHSSHWNRRQGQSGAEPEVQVRFRFVKKGSVEQMTVGDKTRSLREASGLLSEAFDLWELEDMCRVWYNTHPSGMVDREQFKTYATDFLQLPPDAEEHIGRMFKLIDRNNDGKLSFTELSLALATLARGSTDEKLELGFRLNDLNGDGFISGEEVWKAVHVLWLAGGEEWHTMEMEGGSDNELAKAFLRVADTDGDSRISMDEYKVVALRDKRFLKRMARDCAVVEFNRAPEKNLHVLKETCDISSELDFAKVLRTASHMTRLARGEALGLQGVVAGWDMNVVRSEFMQGLQLEGRTLDEALRSLMLLVHPPEDVEKMEVVFRALSEEFVRVNPISGNGSPSSVYGALLAIIKLNTNLHNPNAEDKMTPQAFVHEVRGSFHCDALDASVLDGVYKRVSKDEIIFGVGGVGDEVLAKLITAATLKV